MFGSMKLGKVFGIDFHIHGTFWLLPVIVLLTSFGASASVVAFELLFVFAVFACVALHELGHALAAAGYGIRTRDITLYPIGGVAALERMPAKPAHEIVVALAGPAVNVVIAVGLLLGISAASLPLPWEPATDIVEAFTHRLFFANVVLCVFNLLPAFPMDGGRVLRALLATRLTRLRATEIAVRVGTGVAILMFVAGVMYAEIGLVAIAVVVWLLGQAELLNVRVTEARRMNELRLRDWFGMPQEPMHTMPTDTASDLATRRFTGIAWDSENNTWVRWENGVPVACLKN